MESITNAIQNLASGFYTHLLSATFLISGVTCFLIARKIKNNATSE